MNTEFFWSSYLKAKARFDVVEESTRRARREAELRSGTYIHLQPAREYRINRSMNKFARFAREAVLRNLFYLVANLPDPPDKAKKADLRYILRTCQIAKSPYERYDYEKAAAPGTPPTLQIEVIRRFVETYGKSRDKLYLLPQLSK